MKKLVQSNQQTDIKNMNIHSQKAAYTVLALIKLFIVMTLVFPVSGLALEKNFAAQIFPHLQLQDKTCNKERKDGSLDLVQKPLIQTTHSEVQESKILLASRTPDVTSPAYYERIKKPDTPVELVVNVAARKLKVYKNDKLVKTYSIAVGSPRFRTPLGTRYMSQIVWNPSWVPPPDSKWAQKYKRTPPGPHNPLGPVKMNLGNAILIHGTTSPRSIGTAASHGCMRMKSHEAKELARYIQEEVTGIRNKAVYDKYRRNSRKSFYVKLPIRVPVRIVYNIAEIEDGNLYVYKDIYHRVKNKAAAVRRTLHLNGYKISDINMSYVKQKIKSTRNRRDLTFSLTTISNQKLVNNIAAQ